ncbi:hypothetical protein ACT7DA_04120 [Bacillus pacificus]
MFECVTARQQTGNGFEGAKRAHATVTSDAEDGRLRSPPAALLSLLRWCWDGLMMCVRYCYIRCNNLQRLWWQEFMILFETYF